MLSIQDGPKLAALAIVVGTVGYNAVLLLVVKPMVLKQMRKELGTEVSIKTLVIRPLAGVFELRGLVVKGDTSTTFATIEKLRCTTTGALGTLSLAGPQTFSFGMHVPWVVGFRGKMIEHVAVEGCTVVVDEGNGAYTVGYLATVSGTYQLSVTCNSIPLSGSPLHITVEPSAAHAPVCVSAKVDAIGSGERVEVARRSPHTASRVPSGERLHEVGTNSPPSWKQCL